MAVSVFPMPEVQLIVLVLNLFRPYDMWLDAQRCSMWKALLLYIAVTYVIEGSVYTMVPLGLFNLLVALFVSAILRDFTLIGVARFGAYSFAFFAIYSAVFYASDFVTMKWGSVLIMEGGALTASGWMYVFVSSMLLAVVPTFCFSAEPKRQ
jgi:hypothetical protein